ncbi:MAG: hypothetical protein SGARI_001638, partial [Bacillariaceae sp.]
MFGDDVEKDLSASEESGSSVGSSTLGEEDDGPISDAGGSQSSEEDDDDESSEEEDSSDEDDDDEEGDDSYVGTDDELFEEDDDDEEEEEDDDNEPSLEPKTTIEGSMKSPFTSMETSHSFASEATEERAHVSSPRQSRSPPKKSKVASPFSGKRAPIQVDVPTTPPRTFIPASPAISPSSVNSNRSGRGKLMAKRVPGGAAAKLIGRPADDDYKPADDGDDKLEVQAPLEELMESRDKAKAEFSLGSTDNRRYHAQGISEIPSNMSTKEAKTPSILTRSEVFHENAAAAVAALLSPTYGYTGPAVEEIGSKLSSKSGELASPNGRPPKAKKSENPFHGPRRTDELPAVPSTRSDVSAGGGIDTLPSNSPLVQKLLNKKLDRRLDVIKNRMKDPSKNLTDLMTAIVSPVDGNADRHYMVRRKNACGALKVMTANTSHRVNICWTVGVLPALTSVLDDSGPGTLEETIPDLSTRREFVEARRRAVASLVNLSLAEDNRIPMFHCPKLVASLIRVVNQDDEEAQRGCCMILLQLTKSKDNKYLMAQVPGFLDAVTDVIDPKVSQPNGSSKQTDENHDTQNQPVESKDLATKKTLSEDVAEASAKYDEDANQFIH